MFYCVFILTDLKSEFCDVITYLFFLFLNLQIACVIVPIGQKAHHVLGLKKIITIRPIRSDVRHQAVKSEAELCHPIPKKQNNLLNRISLTRRWVTVYCPNTKFTKEPSARYLLIITKISIANYTVLLSIGLRLYCTKEIFIIFQSEALPKCHLFL